MQQLIEHISSEADLSKEKSYEILIIISDYIKRKYPLLAHTVDSVLEIPLQEQEEVFSEMQIAKAS